MTDLMQLVTGESPKVKSVREQILQSLKRMYPEGVNTPQQHKDAILIYICGWGDALKACGKTKELAELAEQIRPMCDPNWWPGSQWAWWV